MGSVANTVKIPQKKGKSTLPTGGKNTPGKHEYRNSNRVLCNLGLRLPWPVKKTSIRQTC